MKDREFLRDLILHVFNDWAGPPGTPVREEGSGRLLLRPVWLTATQVHEAIKAHATQLPGVGKDRINRIHRDQVADELRAMPNVRRRDANTPREAFALSIPGHP